MYRHKRGRKEEMIGLQAENNAGTDIIIIIRQEIHTQGHVYIEQQQQNV